MNNPPNREEDRLRGACDRIMSRIELERDQTCAVMSQTNATGDWKTNWISVGDIRIVTEAALSTPTAGDTAPNREADRLREWLRSVVDADFDEVVADGGVTAGMVIQQEAREQLRRLNVRTPTTTDTAPTNELCREIRQRHEYGVILETEEIDALFATIERQQRELEGLRSALDDLLTATQPQHTLRHIFLGDAQEAASAALNATPQGESAPQEEQG